MTTQERSVAPITDVDLSHAVQSDACVLFTGNHETTEALARRLHDLSGWRHGPFVVVDCALPDEEPRLLQLLDVANPDASNGTSWPTLAQSGTVFLREVGKLHPTLQLRLSDTLTAFKTKPGGKRRLRRRVISSSSIPLESRVKNGTFDARLFYRLNVIHMVISNDDQGSKPYWKVRPWRTDAEMNDVRRNGTHCERIHAVGGAHIRRL
jgi:DNA-binding NtrC family response regulator